MGNKHRLHNTQTDNLISNLRGEIGDILLTWLIFRKLRRNARYLYTPDIQKDYDKPELVLLEILIDKLENDIVSRLSELAEQEIGQLTFFFAQQKLIKQFDFKPDVDEFKQFIEKENFKARRNQFISHKQLPEKWTDHKEIFISMQTIGKCVALAVKLMIKIDKIYLGPSAIYLWRETLKKKDKPMVPLSVNFMLLPHMKLSIETRKIIIKEEMQAGYKIWECVKAKVNGVERDVIICKKWGAILMRPNEAMVFDDYPLLELHAIDFPTSDSTA
jgi:hypothetical protein